MDTRSIAEAGSDATKSAPKPTTSAASPEHTIDIPPASSDDSLEQGKKKSTKQGAPRDFRFWAIISSLCITGLLSALENTVVTTSLPTIVHDLNLCENYI
ncbi:MAG: hypothetical protein LQ338_008362 [Usnochroma carphineum]|nr:MAG: hypothetical protein LQ338_008362 [Usnochroma carphineum]